MTFEPKFLKRIRKEFPAAETDPMGRKRVFLDNGAGTLVTLRSVDREVMGRIDWSANVGNLFPESVGAEQTILEGRQAVSDLLNAGDPQSIVSGESATSLLFGLGYALGRELTGKENVVTTGYEHYANVSPWVELGDSGLIDELRFVDFDRETFELDLDKLEETVDENTAVITVTAASNVLGTKTDLKRVGKMAKAVGAYFVVDAVHHVAHGPLDVKAIGCDALVFSGYKLFSRHGSFMYMRPELIEELTPYKVYSSPKHGPEKWEWGTRDQAMFGAITGAVDYLAWVGNPGAKVYPKPGAQRLARVRRGLERIEAYEADDIRARARWQGEARRHERNTWADALRSEYGRHRRGQGPDILVQARRARRPGAVEALVGQVCAGRRCGGLLLARPGAVWGEHDDAGDVRALQHEGRGRAVPRGAERGRGEAEVTPRPSPGRGLAYWRA